jgi:hypothetical protein
MKIDIEPTLNELKQAKISHRQRSLKNKGFKNDLFDNSSLSFNGFASMDEYLIFLEDIYEDWRKKLGEMTAPEYLDYLNTRNQLKDIIYQLKQFQDWRFSEKSPQLMWVRVKFDKIAQNYRNDDEIREWVLVYLTLQKMFVKRLISLVKHYLEQLDIYVLLSNSSVSSVPDLKKKVKKGIVHIMTGKKDQFRGDGESGTVVWNLEAVSLVELACAIHQTKGLRFKDSRPLNQSEVAKFLSAEFNFDIGNFRSSLYAAKNRKKGVAPFLTEMRDSFIRYASLEEEKT